MNMNRCYGCGKPIPKVEFVGERYVIKCSKCGCATKAKDNFFEAVKDWNEGHTFPEDEAAFWRMIMPEPPKGECMTELKPCPLHATLHACKSSVKEATMRLIDADKLLEEEQASLFVVGMRNGKSLLAACKNYLKMVIGNAPTVDAVPVVRCEECEDRYDCPRKLKMFRGFDGYGKRLYKNVTVNSCEYGKRRSDGEKL